jgi:sirohydrochlorin ferrochelatase
MTVKMVRERSDLAETALLLIAHGSRHESANDDTRALAAELVRRSACRVAVAAFLELAAPDIDGGAAECVRLGARRVVLLPHFLSAGMHVREDLEAARIRLAVRYPEVEFRLAEPLGQHPLLLDVLTERAREATR